MLTKVTVADPPVKAFLDSAYEMSLLLSCPEALFTFYNSNIMLEFSFGYDSRVHISGPDSRIWDRRSFQFRNSYDFFDTDDPLSKIVDINCKMIENGYCVLGDFDEYYVPGKSSFGEKHFSHNYMISGFDRAERYFILHGYNKAGQHEKYGETKLSFDDYMSAIEIKKDSFPQNEDIWRNLDFQKPDKDNFDRTIDTERIKTELSKYLEPESDLKGINTIIFLADTAERGLDLRNIRLLWEHARIMSDRAVFLNGLGWLKDSADAINKLYAVKRFAESLFNLSLLAVLRNREMENVKSALIRLSQLEKEAFGSLLSEIS